jgi:hypothetical protein
LASIGPVFVPFFVKTTGSLGNRNDVFSHLALNRLLAGAATGAPQVERQVAQEEAALPAMSVQGTGRAMPAVPQALRTATWQAFERTMRARVPDWDARRAAQARPR